MDNINKIKKFTSNLPVEWRITPDEEPALRRIVARKSNYKTALYANIPLVCKGPECPYSAVCYEYQSGVVSVGSRCLPEMALIISYATEYINSLGVDEDNIIDMMLIKDLVTCDVVIDRAQKLLAIEDMVTNRVVGFDADGNPTLGQAEHSANSIMEKNMARKHKILQLLNATPKDRSKSGEIKRNLSDILINIREALDSRTIDADTI